MDITVTRPDRTFRGEAFTVSLSESDPRRLILAVDTDDAEAIRIAFGASCADGRLRGRLSGPISVVDIVTGTAFDVAAQGCCGLVLA